MQRVEHRIGRSLEEFFQERYVAGGQDQRQVADELGVNVGTVSRWMDRLGIPARPSWTRKAAI
jgi:transposase